MLYPIRGGESKVVLSRWSPFATLYPTATYAPLDVQRTESGYRLQAALPGFKPEDVEVTLEQSALTISAKRSEDTKTENGRYLRREVFSGSVRRRLVLPAEVKANDISVTL